MVRRLTLLAFLALLLFAPLTQAADVREPSTIREEQPSAARRYSLGVVMSVAPSFAESVVGQSEAGPILLRQQVLDRSHVLSATLQPSEGWSVGVQLHQRVTRRVEELRSSTTAKRSSATSDDWGAGVSVTRRIAPGHPLEPRLGVSFGWPQRSAAAQLLVSYVRDPVVLAGTLRYSASWGEEASESAALGLRIDFLANDVVRLSAALQHEFQTRRMVAPSTVLTLRVGYAYGATMRQELGVETGMWLRGGDVGVSFGVGWFGNGEWKHRH